MTFKKNPPFLGRVEIFTGNDTGISMCSKDSHDHLWHIELVIDALAQILTEFLFWNLMAKSLT